jgi:hypothetical protein
MLKNELHKNCFSNFGSGYSHLQTMEANQRYWPGNAGERPDPMTEAVGVACCFKSEEGRTGTKSKIYNRFAGIQINRQVHGEVREKNPKDF